MSEPLEIPEDLRPRLATYSAWKERMIDITQTGATTSHVLRQLIYDGIELIERVARLEAQVAALSKPFTDEDVSALALILTMLHEQVQAPTREDICVAMDALIASRQGGKP